MALTPEWRGRIEHWQETLKKLFLLKLGEIPMEGCFTMAQLSPQEALKNKFKPIADGTVWGKKWEYLWLRGTLKLPSAAQGQRIVLSYKCGNEARVLINGREAGGSNDWVDREVLLSEKGVPGTKYDVLIEAYGGHAPTPCGGGPSPDGHEMVPDRQEQNRVWAGAFFAIWQEDLFQAWMDLRTLLEARELLDQNSLRVAEIDEALRQFTLIADLELPREEMLSSVRQARKALAAVLAARNGSTSPLLYCFGHAHIDVAWLWPLAETERKCARTFGTQIQLMAQYPEFKFLQSQPHLYRMTQRLYPELYQQIKAAVKSGRWIAEGGMWVEADTNITGGESLIRQFIHGKRFFREEFGIESELMWLPDVFGYSGALPQIMAGCGIKYFSTQKIFWTYNGGEPFPLNTFWWEGIDGTRILTHIHNDYNSTTNPKAVMQRWNERVQKDGLDARIMPFGWGDGGGGPTREHLEFLRRQQDLEGLPRTKMASPSEYFKREEKRHVTLPAYVGELYFQAHRGTYTTQARTKRGNRRCEMALREAELWGATAQALSSYRYPLAEMDEAWKGVLLNQFHDIIPGSSIERVYQEAEALHAKVLEEANRNATAAARALLKKDAQSLTVFNSLSWPRTALVPLPSGFKGVALAGEKLAVQEIGGTRYAELSVPACGWTTLAKSEPATASNRMEASASVLENECLRLSFHAQGEISSLFDKQSGRELAAEPLNNFRMYKDVPRWFDAWDIDSTYKLQPVEMPGKAQLELLASGPLATVLRIKRKLHNSQLTQEVWLARNSRRIEFRTTVDWHEKHKLLKVNFPVALHASEAVHEIQFGHLRRPNHSSRPFDADRFEVANQKWTALMEESRGAAVLNDCKYGINVDGNSINLTLLRASQAPDMHADQGEQTFTYALYVWNGPFAQSPLIREAYELNVPALCIEGAAGSANGSVFSIDAGNVIIETVKPAEDGSNDVIVRLYEAKHTATQAQLQTMLPLKQVCETDMLENGNKRVPFKNGTLSLDLRPFEIKTLRLQLK